MTRESTPPPADSRSPEFAARQLAAAWSDGAANLDEAELVRRGELVLGQRPRWLRPLARRWLAVRQLNPALAGSSSQASLWILADSGFGRAWRRAAPWQPRIRVWLKRAWSDLWGRPARWPVPALASPGALADWAGVQPRQLDGLADPSGWERTTEIESLRNYRYRWVLKRSTGVRLLEIPKPRLKHLQRRVLDEILTQIPVHPAAHGFVPGRSVRTFVAPHVGQSVVLRLDLADFFPGISAARVRAVFRAAGYRESVSRLLAGLCTNAAPPLAPEATPPGVPPAALAEARRLVRWPHLPQGAPTSPALANLVAHRLDRRLAGLARAAGGQYTRYADDLLFSGGPEFARRVERFKVHVSAIVLEEGFGVAFRKTRVMRRGVRQHAAGVVVNERPNLPRRQFDELKAILCNCQRHGPSSQNRADHPDFRAHLAGRISYLAAIHPARGAKLRAMWEAIDWRR